MARPSTIDRLPGAVREEIGRLRQAGATIDEILAHLRAMDVSVSRSAMGRHVQEIDAIAAELSRSRTIAEAVGQRLGEDDRAGKAARINVEMMQALVSRMITPAEGAAVELSVKDAMLLATTLQKLTSAQAQDQEREIRLRRAERERLRDEAGAAMDRAGDDADRMSGAEVLRKIREEVYGVFDRPGS